MNASSMSTPPIRDPSPKHASSAQPAPPPAASGGNISFAMAIISARSHRRVAFVVSATTSDFGLMVKIRPGGTPTLA